MIFKIGCSGFLNRHWKGVFYPEQLAQSKWFTFYCEHFNTLKLNVTFYKFPTVKMLENWYNKSSLGFTFIVKTPRIITHYKKLQDCSELIEEFYKVCNVGLKEKLGGLLFQFPPSFHYSEETLELIIKSLHPSFNNIVEFRNSSWWNEVVLKHSKKII